MRTMAHPGRRVACRWSEQNHVEAARTRPNSARVCDRGDRVAGRHENNLYLLNATRAADQATIGLADCDPGTAPLTDDDPLMTQKPAPPERQAVLIGGESLLIECAQTLLAAGFGIAAVVSRAPAVRRWATLHKLALFSEPPQLLSAEAPRGFAYLFSITNLAVLAPEVIALPTRAAINFHVARCPSTPA
jgi:hypothetical protein